MGISVSLLLSITILLIGGSGITLAYAFDIDTFASDSGGCDTPLAKVGPAVSTFNGTDVSVDALGGQRDCFLSLTGISAPNNITMVIDTVGTMMEVNAGSGVKGITSMAYDANGAGLSKDFTGSTALCIEYTESDRAVPGELNYTVQLTDGAAATHSVTKSFPFNNGPPTATVCTSLGTFFAALNELDIDRIEVIWDHSGNQQQSADYTVDKIFTREPVGGTFIGVDTASLLVAGAEVNSVWLLPLLTAAGVGIFLFIRKRN